MTAAPDALCPGCFETPATGARCPVCGYDPGAARPPTVLAPGCLLNGQFIVGRVLGRPGGFGITYLAFDRRLRARVAIKEYLPRDLAARAADGNTVQPHGSEDAAVFRVGLEQFEQEAQTLNALDHPNIVRVRQFFDANGTGYLVMEYYPGQTLAEFLAHQPGGRLPEATALALLQPVIDGLRAVHAKGFLHRDIKPANIYLARTPSGGARPLLIDFGAARQAVGERSRSLSVMLTEGYAPFEQYSRKGHQGPWTDVYALAAVLYRCVTGEDPPAANDRMLADDLRPAASFGVSAPLSAALATSLALRPEDRPQSVDALRVLLGAPPPERRKPPEPVKPEPARPTRDTGRSGPVTPPPPRDRWTALVLGLLLVAVVAGAGGYAWWQQPTPPAAPVATPVTPVAPQPPVVVVPPRPTPVPVVPTPRPVAPSPPARQPFEPETVAIPAGSFLMGSPATEPDRSVAEGPQHRVNVPAFEMCKTEVTFAQWDACVADGGCSYQPPDQGWGRGNRPVINVSWDDAQTYLQWLSRKTGRAWRLPSEAEWEYAARAGTTTPFSTGACIGTDQANYNGDYPYNDCPKSGVTLDKTQPVGSYPANPWQLHDMHGNVWEWVADNWHDNYNGAPTDGSAWEAASGAARVLRGGSFYDWARYLRSADRDWLSPAVRGLYLGFRCARAPAASIDR